MFHCENCNKQVGAGQPINKVVLERRTKHYENVIRRGRDKGRLNRTSGWEIVKEIAACPRCYLDMTGLEPKTRDPIPVRRANPRFTDEESNRKWGKPRGEQRQGKKPKVEIINPITLERS